MGLKKVFGIISYFPDNDTAYHIETRKERSRRFRELLLKLEELWPDVDIMVIAQNWQDFELPEIKNKVIVYSYDRLGILRARKELRKKFLESDYDYLIMLDDDARVDAKKPREYMEMLDAHPEGFAPLRKRGAPLNLCAISRYVYSQVDMTDVDPEKSEGFEDNIFVALCFNKFPDKSFIVPEGLVTETSFRYEGPGKCPSTWAKEKNYDWGNMRKNTEDTTYRLYHPECNTKVEPDADADIDLLITYVNSSDSSWVRDFIQTTKCHNPTAVRFRSWGTLKYIFRGVEKYMPFIRQIVLVVAKPSQVPVWVNKENVRVVYHDEFIPKKLLPTFNSCTIESFFWNIKGLSDKIIYFNDDMFPNKKMDRNAFFTGDSPNIKFTEPSSYSARNIYHSQCRSGMDMITKVLDLPTFEKGKIIRPYHISTAMTFESIQKVGELCENYLMTCCSRQRLPNNVNQYIYSYYHYFNGTAADKCVDYKYFELTDKTFNEITEEILQGNHQMLCLNDSDKIKNFARTRYLLDDCFSKKFPIKCRYEL